MKKNSVILLGAGPSVLEGIEKGLWKEIKGQNVWSLNFSYMTMPYLPQREVWMDYSFFKKNIESLQQLSSKGVEMYCKTHPNYKAIPDIKTFDTTRERLEYWGKLSLVKNQVFCGKQGLTGVFALTMAIAEGYKEIFLLGYDYGVNLQALDKLKTHYYQDKLKVESSGFRKPEVYLTPDLTKIRDDVNDFRVYLNEKDVKIWNVSFYSNIPFFSKISYGAFFEYISATKKDFY